MSKKTSADYFGTFTPPLRAPADLLRQPFESDGAVAHMYCCKCGKFFELREGHLKAALEMSNLLTRSSFRFEDFDARKHYILAGGCQACDDEPKPVVQRIGEAPSLRGAQPESE
jgi:hypothetical protein